MLIWQTEKRWTYKGRTCEIQRTTIDDATQLRGLVEVETGVPDEALEASPVDDVRRKRRPKRREAGEYRTWLYFNRSGEEVGRLREDVNELAEYVRDVEI